MKTTLISILVFFFIATFASAKIEEDGTLPKEAFGAKILSVGYRYNWKTDKTEIRVKVQKNKKQHLITFTGEHLPMGAALASRVGKKINISKGTGKFAGLLIIGIVPN